MNFVPTHPKTVNTQSGYLPLSLAGLCRMNRVFSHQFTTYLKGDYQALTTPTRASNRPCLGRALLDSR